MFKALLKKQFLETMALLWGLGNKRRKKNGAPRSTSMVGVVILMRPLFKRSQLTG